MKEPNYNKILKIDQNDSAIYNIIFEYKTKLINKIFT